MKPIRVAVINLSGALSNHDDVVAGLRALQQQLKRDFAEAWGVDARLTLVHPKQPGHAGRSIKPGKLDEHWRLVLLNRGSDPKQRGVHGLSRSGRPVAVAFVSGNEWTLPASHELVEMLANPHLNRAGLRLGFAGASFYMQEIADPVEADSYHLAGHTVSNFVHPAWFSASGGDRYDQMGKLHGPFQLTPHGSIGVFEAGELSVRVNRTGTNVDAAGGDRVSPQQSRMRARSDEIWSDEIWSDEIWSDEIWSDEIWS
jgi:hypothetical protein